MAEQIAAFDAETEELAEALGDTDADLSFELEHQLRDFIVANLGSIEVNGRRLTLFRDQDGRTGREYPTGVGFVDILANDGDKNLYVFELKRARTADHTLGQVLRYMGWLQRHVAEGREVHGVIVAKTLSASLKYAVLATANVTAFEYSIAFALHQADITI